MHVEDFRLMLRAGATDNLADLFRACRSRFLDAANLLELRSPAIDKLRDAGYSEHPVDLWPLLRPFEVLTDCYIDAFFTPQDALFPSPSDEQDVRWSRYFHHVLMPHLLRHDELMRNVLRAVRALPCNDPHGAASAVGHYFAEMTLPETSPAWMPEAVVGI